VTATVRISSKLENALEKLSQRLGEGASVKLLFRPAGDVAVADRGLLAAVLEVQECFARAGETAAEIDPPDAGEWDWTTVPAGLLIVIRDSNALEAVLDAVVAALERNNVAGVFELWKSAPIRDLTFQSPMIACRLRVAGHRRDDGTWQVDGAARDAMVAVADRWCRKGVPDGTPALLAGTAEWVALDAVEDVIARFETDAVEGGRTLVANVGSAALRTFGVYADGCLVLVAGGTHIEAGGWEGELAEFIDLLRTSADQLAYGRVLRGWDIVGAISGYDLPTDWPLRPATSLKGDRPAADAEQANDIFGVQLLGPGYPSELPTTPDWHTEQVGTAARLLNHVDPSAWFSAPFVPTGQRLPADERLVPLILRQARDELAAILSPTPSV
jgi:hypothetical protein